MARRDFGASWWALAWIDALESRARLDPNRLPRGRTYARQGAASDVELAAGEIRALVQGRRRAPYRVAVEVRQFDDEEWERVLDAIAARAGHAAALLDGELEPGIVEDARTVGVELLPDAGDLTPYCSCPDWADPCKHAAAVCYLAARELDRDPFALLGLRGRSRLQVLAELRRRRSAGKGTEDHQPMDEGVRATEAWAREPTPPPVPPASRPEPGLAAVWPSDPPADAPCTAEDLRALASDAATRAWSAYREGTSLVLALDHNTDMARRAAAVLGTDEWDHLVAATGLDHRVLARRARAWLHGGPDGVAMAEAPLFRPDPRVLAAGRQALIDAGAPAARVKVRLNTLTFGDVQVRLGADGGWWRFERLSGAWVLAAARASEPEDLWELS